MEGRGKSRRRNPYQTWKRRASAMLAVLLTLSLVFGDISGLSRTVMAGQGTVREEFRIHREAILKAAEEAIEEGEPLSQPLAITSDKKKTETKYQEVLAADGTVYEIFPEIEQVQDVDSLELRVFIRLEEGADPASYTLTGEEELIFLYVNGGGATAEGRVNIDGYVSDFTRVEPLEEDDDAVQAVGSGNTGGSGSAAEIGSAAGISSENNSAGAVESNGTSENKGSAAAGDEAASTENETATAENEETTNANPSDTMAPEDSAADLTQSADEEEAEDKTTAPDSSQKPEDTLPAETEETEAAKETEADKEADKNVDKEEDTGKPEKNPAESGADASAENGDKAEEKETSESTDKDGSADKAENADKDAADKDVIGDTEKEEDTDKSDDNSNTSDAVDADNDDTDKKDNTGSTVTISLRQIQRVAASLASDSDAEKETTGSTENENAGTGSNNRPNHSGDDEDSYYENTGDPFDEEDAAALEEEGDVFKKVKKLEGIRYDEAVLDEVLAIRAFAVSMEDAGFDKEELLEGAHHLTYTVSEGKARVVYNPEYVRDEAVVTFGIIPAEGMEVYQVMANGEELAETEKTAAIASASEAKRASSSDADVDEERAVYYQIPEVLEDQDVQIQVVEEGYNPYPAFHKAQTVNGVTVTVSAEEGIIPAGTVLNVEEIPDEVKDAVAEKWAGGAAADRDSLIVFDINLMLNGKKLNNSVIHESGVTVTFSGEPVEELSRNAESLEVFTLETPTKEVEAALGGTEEMPVLEGVTAEDIEVNTENREPIDVSGDESVREVSFETNHFSLIGVAGANGVVTLEAGDTEADNPFIRVEKEFVFPDGYDGNFANDFSNFKVDIKDETGENIDPLFLGSAEKKEDYSYFWEIPVEITGSKTYSVTENICDLDGYKLEVKVNGEITETITQGGVDIEVKAPTFEVSKNFDGENSTKTEMPVPSGFNVICTSLSSGGGKYFVWTEKTLSILEREALLLLIQQNNTGNYNQIYNDYMQDNTKVQFYSDKDTGDSLSTTGITYRGGKIWYDVGEQILHFSDPKLWNKVRYGTYSITDAVDADLTITNTYTKQTESLHIQKKLHSSTIPQSGSISFALYNASNVTNGEIIEGVTPVGTVEFAATDFKSENGNVVSSIKSFENLEAGDYYIQEVNTFPGYNRLDKLILIRVASGTDGLTITAPDIGEDESVSFSGKEQIKGMYLLTVTNYSGAELPETGGPGLIMMERFGWMLLLLAMLGAEIQIFGSKRKREE